MTGTQLTIEDLFNSEASKKARDRGMNQAAAKTGPEWLEAAITDFVSYLRTHGPCPLERWREDWLRRGKVEPASQNAYGSVTRLAANRGLIRQTGRFLYARAVAARARRVAEWQAN